MAEEAQYYSGTDSATVKRKYEDSTAPPSSARRATGFSAPPPDSAHSYNSVPPPMDEIQLAKQKAQEIAARLFNNAEAKRPKFDNGGGRWDDNKDFSSDIGHAIPSIPSSFGYGNTSKKIEIPNGKVGVLIGKAGETIKYLQQQSGAKIQITRDMDADPTSLTRDVEIIGSADSVAKADELIKQVLAEAESGGSGAVSRRVGGQPGGTEQFVMQIPNKKVGLVIGKGGETIKNMQASSGARIQVIPLHLPPGDTSTERTVQIDGSSDQIEAAKQLVNEVISDNRQRNPMGGGGGYSQQGYQGQQPGQQMQQPDYYAYTQPGAYSGQYTQQQYGGYPQQASGGYAASWDQSPAQQTTQGGGGGYDYYGQQQSQQTQPPGAAGPTDKSGYGYSQQQGQGYGQDGYGGYSQTSDGQSQSDGNQAPATSAPQSGYSQPPGQNPSYPPQGSSQSGYGTQASGYGGYGQQSYGVPPAYGVTGYGQPPYGAPASYGGQPPAAYGGSYGGGYQQPPGYSSDASGAPASQAAQPASKDSPQ